jgi:hypothetical protein
VCRRPTENRLPGRRLLAQAGGPAGHPGGHGPANAGHRYPEIKQAPVLVKNLLAEFDYTLQPAPSIPFIDTTKERSYMWLLKRYGLPFMYWNLILKGRA